MVIASGLYVVSKRTPLISRHALMGRRSLPIVTAP
jgi:hypothetical protein